MAELPPEFAVLISKHYTIFQMPKTRIETINEFGKKTIKTIHLKGSGLTRFEWIEYSTYRKKFN